MNVLAALLAPGAPPPRTGDIPPVPADGQGSTQTEASPQGQPKAPLFSKTLNELVAPEEDEKDITPPAPDAAILALFAWINPSAQPAPPPAPEPQQSPARVAATDPESSSEDVAASAARSQMPTAIETISVHLVPAGLRPADAAPLPTNPVKAPPVSTLERTLTPLPAPVSADTASDDCPKQEAPPDPGRPATARSVPERAAADPIPVPLPQNAPRAAAENSTPRLENSVRDLAFAARLEPLPATQVPAGPPISRIPGESQPPHEQSANLTTPPIQTKPQAPAPAAEENLPAESRVHPVSKDGEPEKGPGTPEIIPSATSPGVNPAVTASPAVAPEGPQPAQKSLPAETAAPATPRPIETLPDPVRAAAPARDIQWQVNHGEQRVDVRLTERGGEVLVAVRTSDSQLAGALRDGLPGLSSRLEQNGFRAEIWHPAASSPEHHLHTTESHSPETSSDGQNPSRQNGQEHHQPSPRRLKPPAAQATGRSSRKEFAWLMSQLP